MLFVALAEMKGCEVVLLVVSSCVVVALFSTASGYAPYLNNTIDVQILDVKRKKYLECALKFFFWFFLILLSFLLYTFLEIMLDVCALTILTSMFLGTIITDDYTL